MHDLSPFAQAMNPSQMYFWNHFEIFRWCIWRLQHGSLAVSQFFSQLVFRAIIWGIFIKHACKVKFNFKFIHTNTLEKEKIHNCNMGSDVRVHIKKTYFHSEMFLILYLYCRLQMWYNFALKTGDTLSNTSGQNFYDIFSKLM